MTFTPSRADAPTPAVAAGLWSVLLLGIASTWSVAGGYPFGPGADPGTSINALGAIEASVAVPVAVAIGLAAMLLSIAIVASWPTEGGSTHVLLVVACWILAGFLILVVPDYRVLVLVAYTPIFLAGLPFGLLPVSDYLAAFTPEIVTMAFSIAGGLAWAATAIVLHRPVPSDEAGRARIGRVGRWATAIAVLVPLVYAATRWAWALGIPLGISDELLRYGQETGLWFAGAALASLAVGGALLTLGLVMPWGEVWPAWLPLIGGRPVPVAAALVPAAIVAALVTSAGLMFVRLTLTGGFDEAFASIGPIKGSWAALAPELLWPIWGVALGVAAYAYGVRRSSASVASSGSPA